MSVSSESASPRSTYCVCVASHVHYKTQIQLLDRCLESLIHQTTPIDIYVSISFGADVYKKEFNQLILKKYFKVVKFTLCAERKYQMEHIYILYQLIRNSEYDLIFFCDDDDMYMANRVETFKHAHGQYQKLLKAAGKTGKQLQFAGVREFPEADSQKHAQLIKLEVWSHALAPYVLGRFFKRMSKVMHLFQFNFADMFLREFLARLDNKNVYIDISHADTNDMLYRYNTWNNYSISGSLQNKKKQRDGGFSNAKQYLDYVRDQLMLAKLLEMPDDAFNNMKQGFQPSIRNLTGLDGDVVLSQFDKIMKDIEMTCTSLYDQKRQYI